MAIGLYLHIPFCKQKCLYCDFNSYAGQEELMGKYCDALKQEVLAYSTEDMVDTIYFGGGTPTVLGAEQLADLLKILKSHFILTDDCEITAECNPGTMQKEGLLRLHESGFNRLSIGLQSTDDFMLKTLGRIHSYHDFEECFYNARKAGFSNLSIDLMYGLPNQTLEAWQETVREILRFSPEHISCYGLKIEEGTPFARMKLSLPTDDEMRDMYDTCVNILGMAGYERYEISNFAKTGCESRHNCRYWSYEDFVGFGAGAYSCVKGKRWFHVTGILDYCQKISQRQTAMEEAIDLSMQEQMSEFCFLGLRMAKGISKFDFKERFHRNIEDVFGGVLEKNLQRKTMEYLDGRYRIASDFLYVSNGILADFV